MSTWKVHREIPTGDLEGVAVLDEQGRKGVLWVADGFIGWCVAVVNHWRDTPEEEQQTIGYDFEALIALECTPEIRRGLERPSTPQL